MRSSLVLLPLLALAACATPREACIGSAQREMRVVNALVAETQGNIARGYAIEERQEIRTVRGSCPVFGPDGGQIGTTPCEQPETVTVKVPVAIDLNAEQAKLRSLLQRQAQMESQTQARIQQCIATNPE